MKKLYGVIFVVCVLSLFALTFNIGYKIGRQNGFDIALDTVNKICYKQLHNDTTVTELKTTVYDRDTITYYLSSKIIK